MGTVAKVLENQMVMKKRKIQKTGNSFYVSLPQEFVKRWGLKAGEEVAVISKGNMVQVVAMNS